ncbi:MAG: hypothetical protein AB1634_15500 [Thermodesulfobacteriota bacterium]
MRHLWLALAALLAGSLVASPASALDVDLQGFLQGNYAVGLGPANPNGESAKWAEERLQARFDGAGQAGRLFLKADAAYDHTRDQTEVELREGFLDHGAGRWDLRLGRQILTWGLGDLLFINDVFPKDYEAFFAGRPLEYLKTGVDAAKAGLYPDFASFEIVAIPFFTPDHLPDPERFHMPGPGAWIEERPTDGRDTELALRAYRDLAGFDVSLYAFSGFFRRPALRASTMAPGSTPALFYPRLAVYGASAQGRALEGVLSLEAGYYDSRQDRDGADPFVPNDETRFLVGYQRQLWEDGVLGLQYYGERMHDFGRYQETLPPGFPGARRLRDLASVRFTQLFRHQTLRLSFLAFYGLAERDYLVNPEVRYHVSDRIWAAAGAMIFGGQDWSQFGSLDRDDHVYLQMRYELVMLP